METTRRNIKKELKRQKRRQLLTKAGVSLSVVAALGLTLNTIYFQEVTPVVTVDDSKLDLSLEASNNAQVLSVSADVTEDANSREIYKTSTWAEIQAKQKVIDDEAKRVKAAADAKVAADKAKAQAEREASNPSPRANATTNYNYTESAAKNIVPGQFSPPIANWRSNLGDGFQTTLRPNHNGLDFPSDQGTPIYAVADGVITKSEYYGSYGYVVYLESTIDGQTMTTRYAHQPEQPPVRVGQTVGKGDVIGSVGSTGRSTGPHLHFEVLINGVQINPYTWLAENVG